MPIYIFILLFKKNTWGVKNKKLIIYFISSSQSFWEEDEEFYKSFGGAIRNPFQMIDSLMKQSAGEESTTPPTQPLYVCTRLVYTTCTIHIVELLLLKYTM